jgi:hypothetical protein
VSAADHQLLSRRLAGKSNAAGLRQGLVWHVIGNSQRKRVEMEMFYDENSNWRIFLR